MKMSKHTPGPWIVDGSDFDVVMVDTVSGSSICDVYGDYSGEREANAALIAAAPTMYEALEDESHVSTAWMLDWVADRMVNVYGESEGADFVQALRKRAELCRAALKKARGEP